MKNDNRKLIVKFIISAPLVGSFVSDYGDKVEELNISSISYMPYNKNKPASKPKKAPKKGKGKTSEFIMRSMSRNKSQSRAKLIKTMTSQGFDGRGASATIGLLVRNNYIKQNGDTLTYTNGADNG